MKLNFINHDEREIIRSIILYLEDRNYLKRTKNYLVDFDDLIDDFENIKEY